MFDISPDQIFAGAAGFLFVITIGLAWALSKRHAYEHGYGAGLHDRQHQETDWIVKGKLERP